MLIAKNFRGLVIAILILSCAACEGNRGQHKSNQNSEKTITSPAEKSGEQKHTAPDEFEGQRNIVFKGSEENRKEAVAQFNSFLNEFIAALKAKDIEQIKSLTYFPFDTRGMSDKHLILSYTAADFESVFSAFVMQDLGVSLDDERLPSRFDKYMELNKSISLSNRVGRLGDMQFRKFGDGWKFDRVYLSDDTIITLSEITPKKARLE